MTTILNFLNDYFKHTKISQGDHLLIHSDMRVLLKTLFKKQLKMNTDDLINYFLDFVGDGGSVSFPTFNFDFCNIRHYSYNNTKSKMGILSETARKRLDGFKTWNPVYSFKVFGNIPNDIMQKKNISALGAESLFHWFCKVNAKILIFNLSDQHSMTIYHHFEEMKNVSWRIHKNFNGSYEDKNLLVKNVNTSMFVRDISRGVITNVSGMETLLRSKEMYKSYKNNDYIEPRSIETRLVQQEVYKVIDDGKAEGLLYSIK